MGKEFTPNIEHFKNFESLNFKERIELCFVKNNLDTFNIGIDENKVYAISGIKYLDLYKVPDGKKYYYLHPKSEEEENIIIRIFEDNDFFIGRNYYSFNSKVDQVLSFDFLKENWLRRFEKATIKEDYLSEEIEKIKYRLDCCNGILDHFKDFYELGIKKGKEGGMINHYFWDLYFDHYTNNSGFSSFHTLVSSLRAFYNGFFMFKYYAFLRSIKKNKESLQEMKDTHAKFAFDYMRTAFESKIVTKERIEEEIEILEIFIKETENWILETEGTIRDEALEGLITEMLILVLTKK